MKVEQCQRSEKNESELPSRAETEPGLECLLLTKLHNFISLTSTGYIHWLHVNTNGLGSLLSIRYASVNVFTGCMITWDV